MARVKLPLISGSGPPIPAMTNSEIDEMFDREDYPELFDRLEPGDVHAKAAVAEHFVCAPEREAPPPVVGNRVTVPLITIGGPTIHLTNAAIEEIMTAELLDKL